jgi:hypothetical protein
MKSLSPANAKQHGAATQVVTTPLPPRDAAILALLVLGVGVAAVVGVLKQPPRTTTAKVITTPAPLATTEVMTVVSPIASSTMPFSNAWQIFVNQPHGYHISVPATWTVEPDFPNAGDFFASYVPSPGGPPVPLAQGDVPPQEAEVDVVVLSPPLPSSATQCDPFCVGSLCGLRLQQMPRWACTDSTCLQQLAAQPREVSIQLLKDSRLYRIHATIGGPPSAIDRNAETVEAILETFMFDN